MEKQKRLLILYMKTSTLSIDLTKVKCQPDTKMNEYEYI